MNILIRCDGSVEIGMGHVVRCMALARNLKELHNCKIQFAMRKSKLGINQVTKFFPVLRSNEETFDYKNWMTECIKRTKAQILIMDMRDKLGREILRTIKKKTGIKVVTIDDLEDKRLEADLAFYPPIPQLKDISWEGFTGELYSDWEYVILRNEFSKIYPNPDNSIPNILIAMGGTDGENMTGFVINVLNQIKEKFKAIILVGLGYPHLEELHSNLRSVTFQFELYHNPQNIAEIMSKSDLAIISFGVTAYELAALNIPALYLCLSHDHEVSSQLFVREGIGKSLGQHSKVNKQSIKNALTSMIDDHLQLSTMSDQTGSLKISDLDKISSLIIK